MENRTESVLENMTENMQESTGETAHDAIYWQTYQQALDEGYDVRVARAEAVNVEKRARTAARTAERIRIRAEQKEKNGQAKRKQRKSKQAKSKQAPKNKADAVQGKGPAAASRLKLFADVREGRVCQTDGAELEQAQQEPQPQKDPNRELTPAQKKYLLAMYQMDLPIVRQTEIADTLGVANSSTNKIIHGLIDLGLIERYDRFSLALSEKGFLAATSFYDCYNAIAEDLLRDLPPEKVHRQKQATLEAVLKMPQELVQEILQSRASGENFLAGAESLPVSQ